MYPDPMALILGVYLSPSLSFFIYPMSASSSSPFVKLNSGIFARQGISSVCIVNCDCPETISNHNYHIRVFMKKEYSGKAQDVAKCDTMEGADKCLQEILKFLNQ